MKITNFRIIDGQRALVAAFDVEFAPLTVRGIKLFRRDDGGMFIGEPAEAYQKDGQTQYKKHVLITDEAVKTRIEEQAKEIWRSKAAAQPADSGYSHPDDVPF